MTTYKVTIAATTAEKKDVSQTRLVEAKTKAQALAFVASGHITIEVATSAQCVELGAAGVKIEEVE